MTTSLNVLTLRTLGGGGQNDPQRNKCLRNSENRKKKFKKTTNYNKNFCTLLKKSVSTHLHNF